MRTITVKVKPRAKVQKITTASDGSLIVQLSEPPVDGKANAALIEILADYFGVSRRQISIKTGQTSRTKIVEIDMD